MDKRTNQNEERSLDRSDEMTASSKENSNTTSTFAGGDAEEAEKN